MDNETHNPIVHFATVENRHDSSIVNTYEWAWSDFADMFTEGHSIVKSKDTMLFGPWKFKTKDDDYEPRRNDDGEIYLIDGEDVVGRLAANVKSVSMICFDYDGGMTIEHAKNKFAEYAHIGYTSYGHKSPEKGGKDCFRIVLPLEQEVNPEDFVDYRKSICEWAEGVDKSSFALARFFYVPSCPAERAEHSQTWLNHGFELFDVKSFNRAPKYVEPERDEVKVDDGYEALKREWIVDSLSSIHVGYEPTWYSLAVAMYSNGFSYQDFVRVTMSGFMHQKTERDCEQKWRNVERSGRTGSVGFLVNLLKEHGKPMPKFKDLNKQNPISVKKKKKIEQLNAELNKLKEAEERLK